MIIDPDEHVLEERTIHDDIVATTIGFLDEHEVTLGSTAAKNGTSVTRRILTFNMKLRSVNSNP